MDRHNGTPHRPAMKVRGCEVANAGRVYPLLPWFRPPREEGSLRDSSLPDRGLGDSRWHEIGGSGEENAALFLQEHNQFKEKVHP